ncbi:tRNA modification GTPase GTPBP3, mitochondrial-like isoform X2 [Paramacrobiotus metropolitanus]|nr:tRNA modification GTPase GTPBP3, mitochondrial-like isoform X2 [Paramacrobiotus metropolitanus]
MITKKPISTIRPRTAYLRMISHPVSHEPLDNGVVMYFKGPHSFTGEDVAEFHVHGGTAVIRGVLSALSTFPRVRPAEAGEFTKRAFLNGKMDLTEAEGVADLIQAETEAQRKQALRQMNGALLTSYANWRERLLQAVAFLEAHIDFGEEEELEPDIIEKVKGMVSVVEHELLSHLNDHRKGERLRNGVSITIVGKPNVGKSSLLNFLCQRPAAIVSPLPGTTRDIIETALDLAGYPVLLSDTAGLRETADIVESEGVRRALRRAEEADLLILVIQADEIPLDGKLSGLMDDAGSKAALISFGLNAPQNQKVMVIVNKCDLLPEETAYSLAQSFPSASFISCTSAMGIDGFLEKLSNVVAELCGNPSVGEASLTQQRHRVNLEQCAQRLRRFWELMAIDDVTLCAHELQQALICIGKVTGKIRSEEILDVIFRDFCIGK